MVALLVLLPGVAAGGAGVCQPVLDGGRRQRRLDFLILLRRRQNNPLPTGEAGVGKTAVVEGLAPAQKYELAGCNR